MKENFNALVMDKLIDEIHRLFLESNIPKTAHMKNLSHILNSIDKLVLTQQEERYQSIKLIIERNKGYQDLMEKIYLLISSVN